MERRRGSKLGWLILTGVAVLVGTCLCCCVLLAVAGSSLGSPSGLGTRVCAGLVTAPRVQVGVVWISPLSSYLPPLAFSPYAVCVNVPWWSKTPTTLHGGWMFPP
jgi:hypothetical protein